jgi:hypothetical protein
MQRQWRPQPPRQWQAPWGISSLRVLDGRCRQAESALPRMLVIRRLAKRKRPPRAAAVELMRPAKPLRPCATSRCQT